MKTPEISVIVPVYNAEKYLRRCIDSILAQTFTDFELLLINDGSNDHSGEVCDEYAQKDFRIRVFHKENGGVSSARNMGLDNAMGNWVTFIDSDDAINSDYLYSMISQSDADLIMSSFEIMDNITQWDNFINNHIFFEDDIKYFIEKYIWSAQFCAPWCKLYKRSIIDNLRFNTEISLAEDTIFVFGYLCQVKSVRTIEKFDYLYNRHVDDSLSMKYRTIEEYRKIIKNNYDNFRIIETRFNYDGEDERHARTAVMFKQCLNVIKFCNKPFLEKYRILTELLSCNEIQEMLRFQNSKYKGPRRRFFDFLAVNKLYWILFLYVIFQKGVVY